METTSPERAREPLSRSRILRAGVELADERGIERLSMRTLAARLGVEAMSLYNHVANKDDLLDGMVDLVMTEIEAPAPDAPWRDAMRRRTRGTRGHRSWWTHVRAPVQVGSPRSTRRSVACAALASRTR